MSDYELIICLSSVYLVLACAGIEKDKPLWAILLFFSALNLALLPALNILMLGAIETLTIIAICRWAWTRIGKAQVALLSTAFLAHLGLLIDLNTGFSLVYNYYEQAIAVIAILQASLGSNGAIQIYHKLAKRARDIRSSPLNAHSGRVHSQSSQKG